MVLSVLRQFDKKDDINGLITCKKEDFELGLQLMETYIQHSFSVFQSLQKPTVKAELSLKQKFLEMLPVGEFKWNDVEKLSQTIGRGVRTLKNWLDEFCENGLVRHLSHGLYAKSSK